jgi:hypothetical protein
VRAFGMDVACMVSGSETMRLKGAMRLFKDPNLDQGQKFQPPDIVGFSLEFAIASLNSLY